MKAVFFAVVAGLAFAGAAGAGDCPRMTARAYAAGDAVALTRTNGIWRIDYDVTPATSRLYSWRRYVFGWVDVLFETPVELAPEDERILFEAFSAEKFDHTTTIQLRPLLTDEDGELFSFSSAARPAQRRTDCAKTLPRWQSLSTPSFYAGEAGAPAQDVYTLESDGVDFTPGKKLKFLGFRLTLRQNPDGFDGKSRRRAGAFYLGDFSVAGARRPYQETFGYLDGLLATSGVYRIGAQIRDAFQSAPVCEVEQTFVYDAADAASRRQKMVFPVGPDGCYWIDWQVTDASGAVVATESRRADVSGNPSAERPKAVDTRRAPVLGWMRVNPDHAGRGVFEPGEAAEIEVRVFPRDDAKLTLKWQVLPMTFRDVVEEGVVEDVKGSVTIRPTRKDGRDANRLVLELVRDGKVVDRQTYFYGWRNANPLARHDYAGARVDRREYKKHPYNRLTFSVSEKFRKQASTEEGFLAYYRKFLVESKEIATSFTYMIDLKDWQVLPGVYDTWMLDRVLDLAADEGMKVTMRVAHGDANEANLYRWNEYQRQIGSDGAVLTGHPSYGAYSVADPKTVGLWLGAYRALFDRYDGHTAFEGYYIMQPGGEWCVVDQPWDGTVCGYDEPTRRDFQRWLKGRYGTVAALNAAWGASYGGFGEVVQPQPKFRDGAKPDLSRAWIDFCRYKRDLDDSWMKTSVGSIRAYDDDRVTIAYCSPRRVAKLLGDKLDYAHNGGNHFGHDLYEYIDAWERYRVGWISEPIHPHCWNAGPDPSNGGWVLDWTTWVMTAQAAGGGANLHVYYWPWKTLDRLSFWGGEQGFDRFEQFKPILDELHDMKVHRPQSEVAFASDDLTLWTKHRTTFGARLSDLRLWRETLEQDGVAYGNLLPERLAEHRLVLPNLFDEVIGADTFSNYVAAVKTHGAKMIVSAKTGSFVPELSGEEPFQLLKAFGIAPPEKPFCRLGRDVRATCGDDAVLFEKGREIPFETGERLHAQLLDPATQKRYQKFRFRWLPETDYFGYFPGVKTDGRVLATFPDGGAALTLHRVGKGEVIVFWGVPDFDGDNVKGMMAAAAKWAGIRSSGAECPVKRFIEGENKTLDRHYLLLYETTPGTYVVKAPHIPDGTWFVDDPVSWQRLGRVDGKTVREKGVTVTWTPGYSPLKYLRFSKFGKWFGRGGVDWYKTYPNESKDK